MPESADLDEMVRDFCKVGPLPKSEVRRRIEAYASSRVAALEQRIADAIAQLEWISSGGTCGCDDHTSEDYCCVSVGERCVTCESEAALARLREVKG